MFVERVCAEAITRANRRIYDALAEPLSDTHRHHLDDLLKRRDNGKTTWLAWLRQSPAKPNSRHMLEHIERLKAWQALDLPSGIERLCTSPATRADAPLGLPLRATHSRPG